MKNISYNKEIVLGKGSFATVYQGTFGERHVAVKVIDTEFLCEDEYAVKEATTLLLCSKIITHENILKCYHVVAQQETILMALDLCQNNLSQWVNTRGTCTYPAYTDELEITVQITAGLKYLHGRGIVHGDLKPENVLFYITRDSEAMVKLADFGLCDIIHSVKSIEFTLASEKAGWMSPELLRAFMEQEKQDYRSSLQQPINMTQGTDIFSLGCILHFLHTKGTHPFGTSTIERKQNILNNAPNILDFMTWTPQCNITEAMLSPIVEERPAISDIHKIYSDIYHLPKVKEKEETLLLEMEPDTYSDHVAEYSPLAPNNNMLLSTGSAKMSKPKKSTTSQVLQIISIICCVIPVLAAIIFFVLVCLDLTGELSKTVLRIGIGTLIAMWVVAILLCSISLCRR